MICIYGVCYIMPAPPLGKGHYIQMYDDQGELFYQSQNQSNDVDLDNISEYFLKSIVAIEDHRFYMHRGIDPIGILRAIKENMTNQDKSQGGSTITQQYARLMYLTNEKTWTRKISEAFLTIRLEAHYDKDTILQGYMNTVYFGHGIYGIQNASHYYFGKEPKDLDLNESSMLAGVINGPEYYSPFKNMEQAKKRQKIVLNSLVKKNDITQEEADRVYETPLILNDDPSSSVTSSYSFFKDTVIQELQELGLYQEKYINQGLNIQTTLNIPIQNQLNTISQEEIQSREDLELSEIIIDNNESQIKAILGGRDYTSSQFNRATNASRQVGSTIKPLLYYIALENGFTPTTQFKSEATTFQLENGQTYAPTNYNQKYANDDITLAQAIAVSDNIYAVKTHLFLGEQALVNALNHFGFSHISPHPSLALGAINTNIYQLSQIYVTFANLGIYNQLHTIQKISNDSGEILYEYRPENKQLLDKETCLILAQLLRSPFYKEFQTYATPTMLNCQTEATFAAKSGTTSFDSLCAGYNPNYTIVGWCGYDDNREVTMITDTKIPKVIFQKMANFLQQEDIWYEPTDNIEEIPINPITGDYDENGIIYWFKK